MSLISVWRIPAREIGRWGSEMEGGREREKRTHSRSQMTDARLEEIVFDTPLHQIITDRTPCHLLITLDAPLIVAFQRAQISNLQPQLVRQRLGIVVLEPAGRNVEGLQGPLVVPYFNLVDFSKVLLVGGCAPEVSLGCIMVYGLGEDAGGVFGIGLAVGFIGFGQGVCGVVGFGEFGGLNGGSAFEGLTGFFACRYDGLAWNVLFPWVRKGRLEDGG